jgi:hypothetical protein
VVVLCEILVVMGWLDVGACRFYPGCFGGSLALEPRTGLLREHHLFLVWCCCMHLQFLVGST